MTADLDLDAILAHYEGLSGLPTAPMAGGLINDTFAVGQGHVLQRLHRIFDARVNRDIAALVPHLREAGLPVPTLVPTRAGALEVEVEAGPGAGVWRVLTRLPGQVRHVVDGRPVAEAVGAELARFHGALIGVEHTFAFTRPGAHDTEAHMARMADAVEAHPGHRLVDEVAPAAEAIASAWASLGGPPAALPARIVHGDPKVANFLFGEAGPGGQAEVTGVLDLDTMAWATLEVELGDALRSWCSAAPESAAGARFDLGRFEAAVRAYASAAAPWLQEVELRSFARGTARICLELAARFCRDALEEDYFGWDPAVAPTRGAHNLLRATNQLALAHSVIAQRGEAEAFLERLLEGEPAG